VEVIELGQIFDLEGNDVTVEFKCGECVSKEDIAMLVPNNTIVISPYIDDGSYLIEINLVDDDATSPKAKYYKSNIRINRLDPVVFVVPEAPVEVNKVESKYNVTEAREKTKDVEKPTFRIESLSYLGVLEVSFSQKMRVVNDLSLFSDKNLKFELIPHESNQQEAEDSVRDFSFEWRVTAFSERHMTVEILYA